MQRRLPAAIALACLVTFGLFWTMQALIGVTGELKEGSAPPSIDFVRLRKDNQPELKKREPPKREKPEQPPPPPDMSMAKSNLNAGDAGSGIGVLMEGVDSLGEGLGTGAGSDRDVVPLVRVKPDYPMRALQRGIEGWVAIVFTITKIGSVTDPRVHSSSHSVFENPALQAVRKYKYNPKIENGEAVVRPGVKVLIEFEMEN